MPIIDGNTTATAAIFDGNTTATAAVIDAGDVSATGIDFTLTELVDTEVVDEGDPNGTETIDDILFDKHIAATTETHSHLSASGNELFEFASLDTDIATVAAGGQVAWVANGTARILCKGTHLWKHTNVAVSRTGGQSTSTFNSYVAGSFAKLCSDSVNNAVAGKNMAANGSLFTSMNHDTATYVRNTVAWTHAAGIDCTGLSPWNSRQGVWQHGTLIHERIALFAYHYSNRVQIGDTIRFVTSANVVVDRTIDAVSNPFEDAYLVRFSEALPGTIGIVKVLPSTWSNYLPHIYTDGNVGYRVPGFAMDQEKKALVADLRTIGVNAGWDVPDDATRALFYEDAVGGDSGGPRCLVAGTQLVMISSYSSTCLPYSTNTASIDAAMDALVSGAATTKIDLSSYTDYS